MRKIFTLLVVCFFLSCNNSSELQNNKNVESIPLEERITNRVERRLEVHKEEVVLISIIKEVPVKTVFSVLQDYLVKVNRATVFTEDLQFVDDVIFEIATKYHLSKKLTASIIYDYKYGLLQGD